MALVTFAGFPSSGKSTRALELQAFLQAKLAAAPPALARLKVVIVNDDQLELSRSAYDDTRAEKPARATFYSAVIRAMGKETIVIADGMNYIKGSRYQMYCQAREVSVRTCTVFIATPPDKCKEWNATRPEGSRYLEPTLENLIQRFEEPNSAARWDSPLVTIPCDDPPLAEGNPLAEEIWANCTQSIVKPPNVATLPIATSSTSYLSLLESTCSAIISTLLARQALSPLTSPTPLPLPTTPPCTVTVQLARPATLAVCSRLKKQFTKMNMQMGKEMQVEVVAKLFAEYLESHVR